MGWPLLVCSLLVLGIVLERMFFYIHATANQTSTWLRLSTQLIHSQGQAKALRDEVVTLALSELQSAYYRSLKLLRFVGTLSPLLGLLGTILGIIQTFRVVAAHTGTVSPSLIAGGLWEALLTTAFGLMIALPALLMAHVFQSVADRQLDYFCSKLNVLSLSFERSSESDRSKSTEHERDGDTS